MSDFDKQKVLDTTNQWIFNCDTKASIILAALGVFISIILSTEIGRFITKIIKSCISNITVCNVTYLCCFLVGVGLFVAGIYKLMKVLIPTINKKHKSIMFFGNVASYPTFDDYCDTVRSYSDKEATEDLLHQIYAVSVICNQKFEHYKYGVVFSFGGIALMAIWLLIGFIVYIL